MMDGNTNALLVFYKLVMVIAKPFVGVANIFGWLYFVVNRA